MRVHLLVLAAALICGTLGTRSASAATYVNRFPDGSGGYNIQDATLSTQTWTPAGSPYIVEHTVIVPKGVTLTVQPGITVQAVNGFGFYIYGTLNATGTSGTHITFTSGKPSPAAGDWLGIYLGPYAGASVLAYCDISYAGNYAGGNGFGSFNGGYRMCSVCVDASAPSITHCTISNSQTHGIEVFGAGATIQNNAFSNVGANWYDIAYSVPDTFPIISGNSGSGTGSLGVAIPGGTMSTGGRWPVPGNTFPYYLTGDLSVAAGATLTIDPGVAVQSNGPGLYVNGRINAQGAVGSQITFTTRNTNRAPGDWLGILIGPTGGSSILSQCSISYAGNYRGGNGYGSYHSRYPMGAVYIDSSSPTVSDCTISESQTNGIEVYGGAATIRNNTFVSVGAPAYDVYYSIPDTFPVISGNTGVGSGSLGVGVPGGTMAASGKWPIAGPDFPYYLTADLSLDVAATLTIDPGVVVQSGGPGIWVNGRILAQGTVPLPITFTSRNTSKSPGDWLGICITPSGGGSVLTQCNFTYGGAYRGGNGFGSTHSIYHFGTLFVDSSSPTIANCAISSSGTHGLEVHGGAARIQNNTFTNIGTNWYDVYYSIPDTFPAIAGNSGSGTGYPGVGVAGGTMQVGGQWPIAGSSFPYYLTNDLTIKLGAALTVVPGVSVQSGGPGIYVNGALSAQGTEALPIAFTSRNTSKTAGDWLGIYLGPTAGSSVLDRCILSYAGNYRGGNGYGSYHGHYPMGAIFVDSSSPTITNCVISNSSTNGIEEYAGGANIQQNVFQNVGSGSYDVYYTIPDTFPSLYGNSGSGSGSVGVGIPGGTMSVGGHWPVAGDDFPYYLTADLTVAPTAALDINNGAVIKSGGPGIWVNGTILAQGTIGAPVTFTSRNASPAPGDWLGIYLGPTAGASVLSRCNFSYGGNYRGGNGFGSYHTMYHFATIFVDSSSPTISNCAFSNSSTNGIDVYGGGASILNNAFTDIGGPSYAVFYSLIESSPVISGNYGSGTGSIGVGIGSGTTAADGRWRVAGPNFPYYLTSDINIGAGTALTIDPGVTVKSGGPGMWVYGTLSARGNYSGPITFTSRNTSPAAGDWLGIYFGPLAGGSVLSRCTFNYGGNYRGGSGFGSFHSTYLLGALAVDSSNPLIDCISILNSQTNGVAYYAGAARLSNSLIRTSGDGVVLYAGSTAQLLNDTISGNGAAGVHSYTSTPVVANCILSHNAKGIFAEGTSVPTVRYSDVALNTTADYFGMIDQTGTNGNIKLNPLYVDLAGWDLRLTPASPCINTGSDAYTVAGETDRDGGARIWGAHVDMGAYEARSVPPAAYTLADVTTALKAAGGLLIIDLPTLQRLNLENGGASVNPINLLDALLLARKVAGRDPNP